MTNEYGESVPRFKVGDRVTDTVDGTPLIVCDSMHFGDGEFMYWLGIFGSKYKDIVCNRDEHEIEFRSE